MASYLHAAAGVPKKSTFIQATNNGKFITRPGLTSKLISKHLPLSLPTLKVHLKQYHQNITSTKKIATIEKTEAEASPTQESKTQYCLLLWHQRKPKQCTQTSLEDIQLF